MPPEVPPSKDNLEPQSAKIFSFKSTKNSKDALVNFSVNNPIPPLKRLAKKILGNEEITIKIPVLTAIAIVAFGLGGASGFLTALKTQLATHVPLVQTIFPTSTPAPTANPWVTEVFFGTLTKQVGNNFFLVLENGNVIRLEVPENVKMDLLVGKKILAEGSYNFEEKVMKVESATDLRLFASTAPVPTITPTLTPSPTVTPEVTPQL